ncbi:cln3like protein [Plasmopara halstedii]|uniref:Cln3like protein n=1 Tax=Plasmopara halstedii TaxID=4781 RepID=A0A0N7L7E8_PLAHL|nr:cln3like protein [Plasmopara halstedii]CEG46875.1 cln3like protein [Plasmopara halstedii]|eukprot:XP_024583244.1 cln3like protein [Plasmopara halstedii]
MSTKHPEVEQLRNLLAFWVLGFINNIGYVIMIAGAQEIAAGGVGLVYFFDIFPALFVKLSGPYWFQLVSYRQRTIVGASWMILSFLVVANGKHSLWLQLLGVGFSGLQSGMMEASFLAMSSFYASPVRCLTCWSSGTGLAGVGGYAWIALFHIWGNLSFQMTLKLAIIFPILYLLVFLFLLDTAKLPSARPCNYIPIPEKLTEEELKQIKLGSEELVHDGSVMRIQDKVKFILTLGPYIIPLTTVYFAEYTMQTGVWSSIGFPVEKKEARAEFYTSAGLAYQVGVFISRSSGVLFQATRPILYFMPMLQVLLLGFFTLMAVTHLWYNWGLLILCFVVGLLGGGVYVNAYTLLSKEISSSHMELALAAASVGDTVGVMLADCVGLFLQGCLYSINRIPGATIDVSC